MSEVVVQEAEATTSERSANTHASKPPEEGMTTAAGTSTSPSNSPPDREDDLADDITPEEEAIMLEALIQYEKQLQGAEGKEQ